MVTRTDGSRRGLPRLLSDLVERPAVASVLDARAAMTLVLAPAGHGKSVAVNHWVRAQVAAGAEASWVDLAHLDTPEELLERLVDLAGVCGGPALPPDPAGALARHLAKQDRPILVFDNLPPDRPALVRLIAELSTAHGHLQVVLCSRTEVELGPVAVRVDSRVLRREHLLLSEAETGRLAALLGWQASPEQIRAVVQATEGWPLWTQVALRDLRHGERDFDGERLGRHFLQELTESLPDDRIQWLLDVSNLPVLDEATVARLTGPGGVEHLRACAGAGLLLPEGSADVPSYRMHVLTRGAVATLVDERRAPLSRARLELARELVAEARSRGDVVAAIREALLLDDLGLVVDLARAHWPEVLADETLTRRVLGHLPEATYAQYPDLQLARAWFELWSSSLGPEAVPARFDLPEGVLASPAAELLEELFAMIGHRAAGRLARADDAGRRLLALVPAHESTWSTEPTQAAILPVAVIQALVSRQLTDDWVSALPVLVRLRESPVLGGLTHLEREVDGAMAHLLGLSGDLRSAQRWSERVEESPPPAGWIEHRMTLQAEMAQMWAHMERLDPAAAERSLRVLRRDRYVAELWPHVVETLTTYELFWGDPEAALADLREVSHRMRGQIAPGSYAAHVLLRLTVDLRLALGQTSAVPPLLELCGPQHPWAITRQARLDLARGDAEAALLHRLEPGRRTARDRVELDLSQAAALARLGKSHEARDRGQRVAAVLRRSGMRLPLAYLPGSDRRALAEVSPDLVDLALPVRAALPLLLPEPEPMVELTERERSVLGCLAAGLTREEAARELFVSVNTVKSQIGSLYRKIGVSERSEVLARARALGLL